jgi:hypothetical protein
MHDSNNMQSRSAAPNSEVEGQLINISVETATNGVFLDQNDADLFAAVKNGDTNLVKSKLNADNIALRSLQFSVILDYKREIECNFQSF